MGHHGLTTKNHHSVPEVLVRHLLSGLEHLLHHHCLKPQWNFYLILNSTPCLDHLLNYRHGSVPWEQLTRWQRLPPLHHVPQFILTFIPPKHCTYLWLHLKNTGWQPESPITPVCDLDSHWMAPWTVSAYYFQAATLDLKRNPHSNWSCWDVTISIASFGIWSTYIAIVSVLHILLMQLCLWQPRHL